VDDCQLIVARAIKVDRKHSGFYRVKTN